MARLKIWWPWLALAAIVVLGATLRAWGLGWGLYNAYVSTRAQPDEWVVYWVFQWFGGAHPLDPCPSVAAHRCFFDWGTVYLYLSYPVYIVIAHLPVHWAMFGPHADVRYVQSVLAGRITSVVMSTATIPLIFILARRFFGSFAALAAALLCATSGLLIQLSHFASPDSTTVFLVTLALLCTLSAMREPSARRYSLAGLVVGLAVGCEYHMVLLALPGLTAWLLTKPRRASWLWLAMAAAVLALVVTNVYAIVHAGAFVSATLHMLQIRTVDSAAEYQGRFNAYGPSFLYVIRYPLGYGAGFALSAVLLAGTGWSLFRRHRADVVLLAWLFPYAVLISVTSVKFMRYGAPLFPVLVILGGSLIADLLRARNLPVRRLAVAGLAAAVAYTSIYDAAYASLFSRQDPRAAAASWLVSHAAPGSTVAYGQLPDGLLNLPYFVSEDDFRPCFTLYLSSRLFASAPYLLVDTYALEEHPRFTTSQVKTAQRILATSPSFRQVYQVNYVPQALGIKFSIAGAPHDWRYPAHVILIYQRVSGATAARGCYPTLATAISDLYHPSKY